MGTTKRTEAELAAIDEHGECDPTECLMGSDACPRANDDSNEDDSVPCDDGSWS